MDKVTLDTSIIWQESTDGEVYYRMVKAYNPVEKEYYYILERTTTRNSLGWNWVQITESEQVPNFNKVLGKSFERLAYFEKINKDVIVPEKLEEK